MTFDFQSWRKQGSTIQGIQAIAGTCVAAAGLYAKGMPTEAILTLAAGVSYGVIGLILPDNTAAAADTRDAVSRFVTDVQAKDQQRAMADALNGAVKVLSDIAGKMQPALATVTVSNTIPTNVAVDVPVASGAAP